ncbi:hypothetical protein BKA61DRAFT_279693 [Leptodontidium sp. MPI-SDFR-AT-0119]|nr:hypothetical protein BKA61DRAFT_279693 [Leptodontidium sp. MPI-SDFR-AT-0119]
MQPVQPQEAMGPAKQFYRPGRRPRIPLSCDPCRTRKLKCNREKPCQNCTARDERSTCNYKGSKNGSTPSAHQEDHGVDLMQQRIDHLEGLVKKLIAQRPDSSPSSRVYTQDSPGSLTGPVTTASSLDASDVACSTGTTVIDGSQSVYKGADDWYDVLQEINKIKNVWSQTQHDQTDYNVPPNLSNTVDGSSLLFCQVKQTDILEILATLPPKPVIDKLLSQFFDQKKFPITVAPILHEPTFMREYAEHWKEPSRTNVMWLGLLFSILSITMLSYHQFYEPPEYEGISESLFHLYRMRTAQCLITGDIAKCLPYTLETLRFNATAELNRKDDNSRGLWITTGVIIRAAINMGYHRDPSRSPSISTLKAEYRRRVWFSVIGMDDLASFQVGFPRMVPAIYSDTMEPRNLHDWELSDDTTVLPPSRPLTEPTAATYVIVKGRLSRALGRITDFNNTPGLGSYDAVLEIDNALYEAYQVFPPHMKVGGSGGDVHSFKDKSEISNFQLASLYHQGMCTLHRKFIAKSRLDPQYNLSRDRCISSALAILSYQHVLDASWYKFSQTRQMLTLAAMILFLELEYRRKGPDPDTSSDSPALLQALENSCALWEDVKPSCDEALRVCNILVGMLSSFHTTVGSTSSQTVTPEPLFEYPGFNPQLQPMNGSLPLEKDFFSMSNEMDIDWGTWDALIGSANFGDGFVYQV